MGYVIDAWLERDDPFVSVLNAATGAVIMHWNADIVKKILGCGDLCPEDFRCQNRSEEFCLIREMFLLDAAMSTQGCHGNCHLCGCSQETQKTIIPIAIRTPSPLGMGMS
jgi:hypothetical protein